MLQFHVLHPVTFCQNRSEKDNQLRGNFFRIPLAVIDGKTAYFQQMLKIMLNNRVADTLISLFSTVLLLVFVENSRLYCLYSQFQQSFPHTFPFIPLLHLPRFSGLRFPLFQNLSKFESGKIKHSQCTLFSRSCMIFESP